MNDLNPALIKFVIDKYYHDYMHEHWDDLFSYGLEALYKANTLYDADKTCKNFKYFATCVIKQAMFGFIRDRLTKTFKNTTYTDKTSFLEECRAVTMPSEESMDLKNAVKSLSPIHKEIIIAVYYKGYKIVDYARLRNINYKTAQQRHDRALTLLKERLQYEL